MILSILTASAYAPLATCGGTPTHWNGTSVWRLHDAGPMYSGLSNAQVTDIMTQGFDVWSDTTSCCSTFSHSYAGTTGQGYSLYDSTNTIGFEETSWDPALGSVNSVIAVTWPAYTGNCTIVNGDQLYNAVGFNFSASNSPGWGQTDLQSIAAHEHGHWVGLDHSSVYAATMYYAYTGGTGARTLHDDDEAGVCNAYPGTCPPPGPDPDPPTPTGTCTSEVLACDTTVSGTNAGGTNLVTSYSCSQWESTGPEAVYTLTPAASGTVTLAMTGLSADLDLYVTDTTGCSGASCVGNSTNANVSDELVTFDAVAGTTYTIFADGWQGATSSFSLAATCPAAPAPPTPAPPTPAPPTQPDPEPEDEEPPPDEEPVDDDPSEDPTDEEPVDDDPAEGATEDDPVEGASEEDDTADTGGFREMRGCDTTRNGGWSLSWTRR